MKSSRSELVKVDEPGKLNYRPRTAYYTDIDFVLEIRCIQVKAKVDTGSVFTVVGLECAGLLGVSEEIKRSGAPGIAYDAQGHEIALLGYPVRNFRLTDEIMIPKIKIWFSEQLGDKALLGMDVLSLFDFQYLKERHSSNGTFWLVNWQDTLSKIAKRTGDYFDPGGVFMLEAEKSAGISNVF